LPACPFLHGFLNYYGIKLNHLNLNSILHLSFFVHLCETFLGIPPSITLFRYFFKLKPHPTLPTLASWVAPGSNFDSRKSRSILTTPWLTW
jgi:hypothetical protein